MIARALKTALALTVIMTAALASAPPSTAVDGKKGERCLSFRGADRCAYMTTSKFKGYPKQVNMNTFLRVNNGGGAEILRVTIQRKTASGWTTVKSSDGPGPSGNPNYASYGTGKFCPDMAPGKYRSRGKVHWTSRGVHYKRWIASRAVSKGRLC